METSPLNPFAHVTVQPSYGKNRAFVTWDVNPGFEEADFFVYRSPDGVTRWELLNDAPVRGSLFFEDVLVVENRTSIIHYRIIAEMAGVEYLSPVIGIFGKLRAREYAGARQIMKLEYLQMSRGDGQEVLLYVPLIKGTPCAAVDTDTGQQFNAGVAGGADCYGTAYRGGFAPPLRTWIKLLSIGPGVVVDAPEGQSSDDPVICKARCLPFPRIKPGDLIIHPRTDSRYAVSKSVQGYFFAGLVAVAYDFDLQLLQRDDPRYRVPVPAL